MNNHTITDRIRKKYGKITDLVTLKKAYRDAADEIADAIPDSKLCLDEEVGTQQLTTPGRPLHTLKIDVIHQVREAVDPLVTAPMKGMSTNAHSAARAAITAARWRRYQAQETAKALGIDLIAEDAIPTVIERLQTRLRESPYGQAMAAMIGLITADASAIKGACFIMAAHRGASSAREYADHAVASLRWLKERYSHHWCLKLEADRGIRGLGAASAIRDLSEATIRREAELAYRATELFYRPEKPAHDEA